MQSSGDEPADRIQVVREGRAVLRVPASADAKAGGPRGPGRVESGLFYNPAMRFARDLTVLFIAERAARHAGRLPLSFYEGLAATGVRGIRVALEVDAPLHVTLNDRDEGAAALMRANVDANGVAEKVTVRSADFAVALATQRFDHVDVDPYGSPAPFLDAAIRGVRNRGTLALTATDMTALCGVFPEPCLRRYDAWPWHGPAMHEVALRILIGAAVRHAARFDVALTPLLSHSTDHYVRVFLEARAGAQRADLALKQIGRAVEDDDGTRRLVARDAPRAVVRDAGPLWTGRLHDPDLVAALEARLADHAQLEAPPLTRFLGRAATETDAPPLFYEIGEVARRARIGPPKTTNLLDALRERGFRAARTHVSDTAFKTDAPMSTILEAVGEARAR